MPLRTAILTLLLLTPLLGCRTREIPTTRSEQFPPGLQIRWAETSSSDGLIEMTVVSTGETVYLHKEVLLTGSDVDYATPIPAKEGPAIILRFTAEGKEKIANMTAKSVGRRYAIIVDGKVITAPKIVEPIPENATIFGFSSMTEAKSIAEKINRRDLHDQKEP